MKTKISPQYILICLGAVIFTWITHEFAHWFTGEILGYDMTMTLNGVSSSDPYKSTIHKVLVNASGPLMTLIQAFVFFFILSKHPNFSLFPFLFTPFYMRFLAGGMNFISLNDEGKIGEALGIGIYTLPIIISAILFILVLMVSKKWVYQRKFIIWTTLLIMLFSSILILADQFFKPIILG